MIPDLPMLAKFALAAAALVDRLQKPKKFNG
jgi:hypothetical protein